MLDNTRIFGYSSNIGIFRYGPVFQWLEKADLKSVQRGFESHLGYLTDQHNHAILMNYPKRLWRVEWITVITMVKAGTKGCQLFKSINV